MVWDKHSRTKDERVASDVLEFVLQKFEKLSSFLTTKNVYSYLIENHNQVEFNKQCDDGVCSEENEIIVEIIDAKKQANSIIDITIKNDITLKNDRITDSASQCSICTTFVNDIKKSIDIDTAVSVFLLHFFH